MPMTWNDQTDAKLLVAILHTTSAKLDYGAIAEYMGPECTKVAVQTRITRLKKQVHDASNPLSPGGGEASAAASPEKRKRMGKAAKEKESGKKSPMKKVKGEEVEVKGEEGV